MTRLTLITSNLSKVGQYKKYLNINLAHKNLELLEIQSTDIKLVLAHKVKEAFKEIGSPVLVDDTGLIFKCFGKLPGPFIKWFASELGYKKVCLMVNSFSDRSAKAQVGIAFYDGKKMKICLAEIAGSIAKNPTGEGGMGWDCIFIPKGKNQTRSQMKEKDYNETSPRRLALEKLKTYFKNHE